MNHVAQQPPGLDSSEPAPGFCLPMRVIGHGLIATALAWFFCAAPPPFGDGQERFISLDRLLGSRTFDDSPYSLVGPLGSAPLWLLGKLTDAPAVWCGRYNAVLLTVAVCVLYRQLRGLVSDPVRHIFIVLLVFASMFPNHVGAYYGEVFTAVLVSIGALAISSKRLWTGAICLVIGTANTPAAVIGLLVLCCYLTMNSRRARWLLPVIACGALIMLENQVRRGSPLGSGYDTHQGFRTVLPYSGLPWFSYPFLFGFISILLSFGKGILFFVPGVLVPVAVGRAQVSPAARFAHRLLLLYTFGLVLVYSKWWSWYGGWFWGPRFFLIACVPACLALAANLAAARALPLWRNLLTFVFLTLSFWVGANGLVFSQSEMNIGYENDYAWEVMIWYVPEFSALWRPFVVTKHLSTSDVWSLLLFAMAFLYTCIPLSAICVRQAVDDVRAWWARETAVGPWRL